MPSCCVRMAGYLSEEIAPEGPVPAAPRRAPESKIAIGMNHDSRTSDHPNERVPHGYAVSVAQLSAGARALVRSQQQQHVEPVCVDRVLAWGPLKDSEAPVRRCHQRHGVPLILDELRCR